MMEKMPAIFIGHGSPMNIVWQNNFTAALADWGRRLPRPAAILVVSAHWLTRGTYVTSAVQPSLIYDFYGFPAALYQQKYASPGSPAVAEAVRQVCGDANVLLDERRGIDHAAWAVLTHMYPQADIPVLEMSLNWYQSPEYHYELGRRLQALRTQGVLVIGSGNIVHNLAEADFQNPDAPAYDWARRYDEIVADKLMTGQHEPLLSYLTLDTAAKQAVPSPDHYLPLLYTIGMQQPGDQVTFPFAGMQNASVSMRCVSIDAAG